MKRWLALALILTVAGCSWHRKAPKSAAPAHHGADWADIAKIRDQMKALGIFDHEGYSGPATKDWTATINNRRIMLIGGSRVRFCDTVDEAMRVLTATACQCGGRGCACSRDGQCILVEATDGKFNCHSTAEKKPVGGYICPCGSLCAAKRGGICGRACGCPIGH